MAHRDTLREDQVQHQEENRRSKEIDGRSLNEAETAKVLHFFQLELKDLLGCPVQPVDLLLGEPETLNQLYVPQRFRGRASQCRCFRDDRLLNHLDLPAQDRTEISQKRHCEEENGSNQPVHA